MGRHPQMAHEAMQAHERGNEAMARTTRKHVESAFDYFLSVIGGSRHEWTRTDDGCNVATPGGYNLDYNPTYGGYVIGKIVNEAGGESRPFGDSRRSAGEMYDTLHFAVSVVRELEKNASGQQ
jgi:hypothetical protein